VPCQRPNERDQHVLLPTITLTLVDIDVALTVTGALTVSSVMLSFLTWADSVALSVDMFLAEYSNKCRSSYLRLCLGSGFEKWAQ